MFQLVVAVISIALIAFLALTSLYYGGDAFQASSLRAGVTTLVNAGQQIAGAAIIYKTDTGGVAAPTVAELVSGSLAGGLSYLSSAPGGSAFTDDNAWVIAGNVVTIELAATETGEICTEVARQAGNTGMFACDATGENFVYKLNGAALVQPTIPAPSGN